MKYNLVALSWQEFEVISFKCLQYEVGYSLQFLEGGSDKGRDFVFTGRTTFFGNDDQDKSIVFQAKHKSGKNGFAGLRIDLAGELVKIYVKHVYNYTTYCLVTNLLLSGSELDQLHETFHATINENKINDRIHVVFQVISYRNLESSIEQNSYIQWAFPSILSASDFKAMLSAVLDRSTNNLSSAWVDTFSKSRSRFVYTTIYDIAIQRLLEENTVLLSGPPKSGKTFTAEMLILNSVGNKDFTPYLIDHIEQFFSVYDKSLKQVFLFDDVFGRHDLDLYKAGSLERKFEFVFEMIDDEHKCIFTSREYIVRSFANRADQDVEKYLNRIMVETSRLSNGEKESILIRYLMLKFPSQMLSVSDISFITAHRNFSPETIRAFFDDATSFSVKEFFKHMEMPDKYLEKVFVNLPDEKRMVLLSLLFALRKHEEAIGHSFKTLQGDLNKSLLLNLKTELSVLDGSLLLIHENRYAFYHPSMVAFFVQYLSNDIAIYRSLLFGNLNLDLLALFRFKRGPRELQLVEIKSTDVPQLLNGMIRVINNPHATLYDINTILYWLDNKDMMVNFRVTNQTLFNSFKDSIRDAISRLTCEQKFNGSITELEDFLELVNQNRTKILIDLECYKRILKLKKSDIDFWRVVFKIIPIVGESVAMDIQYIGRDWLNSFYISLKSEIDALGSEIYGDDYPKFEEVVRYNKLIQENKFSEANSITRKQRLDYKRGTNKYWYPRYRQCAEKMNALKTSGPIGFKIHELILPNFQHLKVMEDNQRHRYLYNRINKWWK